MTPYDPIYIDPSDNGPTWRDLLATAYLIAWPWIGVVVCATLVMWAAGCKGVPQAKVTHDSTATIRANETTATAAIQAADAKTEAVRTAPDTPAPAKTTLSEAHVDHGNAIAALAGNVKPLAKVDVNADELQADRDREHNTWGNRIERFIKSVFWWIVGIVGFFGVVAFVLTLTPAAPIVAGAVPVVGHIGAGLLTGFIPHVLHGIGWILSRVIHRHAPTPPATAGTI